MATKKHDSPVETWRRDPATLGIGPRGIALAAFIVASGKPELAGALIERFLYQRSQRKCAERYGIPHTTLADAERRFRELGQGFAAWIPTLAEQYGDLFANNEDARWADESEPMKPKSVRPRRTK